MSFNHAVAERIAENFVRYVKTKSSTLTFFSVIRGLDIDFEEEQIWELISLRSVNDQGANWLARNFPDLQTNDNFPGNNVLVTHTMQYDLGLYDVHEPQRVINIFEQVVFALHLINNQTISRENTIEFFEKPGELGTNIDIRLSHGKATKRSPRTGTYKLNRRDLPELKRILRIILNRKEYNRLELAIRRFQFASAKGKYENEDKLLDLFMALRPSMIQFREDQVIQFECAQLNCSKTN